MEINIRSISKFSDAEEVQSNNYLLISKFNGNSYQSNRASLSTIVNFAENQISSDIQDIFGLSGVNVGTISAQVYNLYHGDVELNGTKTFVNAPRVLENIDIANLSDENIVTKGNVQQIITQSDSFFGISSIVDADPQNSTPQTNRGGIKDGMVLKIPEGGNDSEAYAGTSETEGEGKTITCSRSGLLTIYGWLTDDGNVQPQEAWVGLYGKVRTTENSVVKSMPEWVLLQLQPWAVTTKSNTMGYVGFSIPVQQGLELKIKTGFRVANSSSATNRGNTLMFANVENNTFVGYITYIGR